MFSKFNPVLLSAFFSVSGIGKLKQLSADIKNLEQDVVRVQIVKAKEFAESQFKEKIQKFIKDKDFKAAINHILVLKNRIENSEQKEIFGKLISDIEAFEITATLPNMDPRAYADRSTEELMLENACLAFGHEISSYSKNVASSIGSIIDILISHNGISLLSYKDKILELCNTIDNNTATFSPETCNDHSYQLAVCLYNFINKIDFKNDFAIELDSKAVKGKIDVKKIITDIKSNLKYKIDVYDMLKEGASAKKLKHKITSYIFEKHEAVLMNGFKQLMNNYETVNKIPKEELEKFKQTYVELHVMLINQVEELPYTRISNGSNFVNTPTPYKLCDVIASNHINGSRSDLIRALLRNEKAFNEETGLSMTYVRDYYTKAFSLKKCEEFKTDFTKLCDKLILALEEYIEPANKFSLRSTAPEKIECAKHLLKKISEPLQRIKKNETGKGGASDWNCFEIYHAIITAKQSNEDICQAKSIGLGRLSDILNPAAIDVFNKIFYEMNETNDVKLTYLAAPRHEQSIQLTRKNSGTIFQPAPTAERENTNELPTNSQQSTSEVSSITIQNSMSYH